ncbi:hypothetical protein ES705_45965 [subsurface metagenome]
MLARGSLILVNKVAYQNLISIIMAIVKFGSIVTGGSGSLGGHTIQNSRSGYLLRNKPLPKKSRTQAQYLIRSSGHSLWLKYQFDALQKGAPFMSNPSVYPGPYLGNELIKNGTFDNWDYWSSPGYWTVSGGKAHFDALGTGKIIQALSLPINTNFQLSFDISNCPSTGLINFYFYNVGGLWKVPYRGAQVISNGSYIWNVESFYNSTNFYIYAYSNYDPFDLDNLSLRQIYS